MALERISLSVADARDLAEGALRGIGFDDNEARVIADHVVDAALCGYEYSGLAKILNLPASERFKLPRRPMKVLRETDVSIAFDGGNNIGMLSLFYAAEATISKAAAHGIALVSVTDAWMSGRSAYYIEMIATPASLRSTQRPVHGWWLRPRRPVTTFRQRRRIVRHWRWTQEIWTKSCCPRSLVAAACRDPLRAGTSMQLSPSRSTCG